MIVVVIWKVTLGAYDKLYLCNECSEIHNVLSVLQCKPMQCAEDFSSNNSSLSSHCFLEGVSNTDFIAVAVLI